MDTPPVHTIKFDTDRDMFKFMADSTGIDELKKKFPPPQYKAEVQFMTNTVLVFKT